MSEPRITTQEGRELLERFRGVSIREDQHWCLMQGDFNALRALAEEGLERRRLDELCSDEFNAEFLVQKGLIAELEATNAALTARVEELRESIRQVAGGAKTLVRCGCLGCLTDDCDHWGIDCTLKDFTLCRIGRTIDTRQPR